MLAQPAAAAKPIERRRHQRVRLALMGRYMLSDRREFPCQVFDMSPGGLALHAPMKGAVGERVVLYLDQIGRVEGMVTRTFETGFALALILPVLKREKIADQLTWLANRHSLGMKEDRRHERIEPLSRRTTMIDAAGREYPARMIDISISGAAMQVDFKAPLGTLVTLGKTPGRIVRVFEGGIAIEFLRPIPDELFSERTQL